MCTVLSGSYSALVLFSFQTFHGRFYLILKFVIRFIENAGERENPGRRNHSRGPATARPTDVFPACFDIPAFLCKQFGWKRLLRKKELKKRTKKEFLFLSVVVIWPPLEISQTGKKWKTKKKGKEMFFHDQVGWHPQLPLFYNISRLPAMEKFRFACF